MGIKGYYLRVVGLDFFLIVAVGRGRWTYNGAVSYYFGSGEYIYTKGRQFCYVDIMQDENNAELCRELCCVVCLIFGSTLLTCKIMFLLWKNVVKTKSCPEATEDSQDRNIPFPSQKQSWYFCLLLWFGFLCTFMCQFCLLASWPASSAWKLMGMSAQTGASKPQFFHGGKCYLIGPFKIMHWLTSGLQEEEAVLSLFSTEAPNYLVMDKCKGTLEKAEAALPNWKLTGWGPAVVQKLYSFIRGALCPNKQILLSIRAESHPSAAQEARAPFWSILSLGFGQCAPSLRCFYTKPLWSAYSNKRNSNISSFPTNLDLIFKWCFLGQINSFVYSHCEKVRNSLWFLLKEIPRSSSAVFVWFGWQAQLLDFW